jgi:hypothetical protein
VVYFKKYDPRIQLRTGMGSTVPFEDIGGQWGLLETKDNYLIAELRKCQREQRGGVMEITAQEFDDLKKKENQTSFPNWREQVGHLHLKRVLNGVQKSAAAAARPLPFTPTGFSEAKAVARPQAVSTLVPKTIRRN